MTLAAVYVDTETFTVTGDYSDEFEAGRKVRANCGADGYKYGVVLSSSYSSPSTTVALTPGSDALTSDLASVEWSVVKPGEAGNIPTHTHAGEDEGGPVTNGTQNVVVDVVWGERDEALTWTDVQTFECGLETDTISEETDDTGVTVDGLLIKDGNADGVDLSDHAARHDVGGDDALSTVPDHDHSGDAGDGAGLTAYAALAEDETITGEWTFQDLVDLVASAAAALLSINQQGTGDIAAFQDDGTVAVRVPDQGGIVLVPQAGGFQDIDGLLAYDSTKDRLVLYHEHHNYPVPVDGRNTFQNIVTAVDYS
jgi:hypothetical protein